MADDLQEFPIVILEADSPEQIGKIGLFDYLMPVGSTGFVFVAAVPGRLYKWGIAFTEPVKQAANLRAASTLALMGIIRGETFAFLRNALQFSQSDAASIYNVSLATVQGWENNSIPIPVFVWGDLSCRVSKADSRGVLKEYALTPDFRSRKIRVFPCIPMQPRAQGASLPCTPPVTLVGPDCVPPGIPSC